MSSSTPVLSWRAPQLWAVGVLALVLRLFRFVNRWDELALAYSAYAAPASTALAAGRLDDALSAWVGLHPPTHALALAILDLAWPAPAAWMTLSILFSVGAVVVVGRMGGVMAALVVATAPLVLQDAAEINNYPLAVLGMALLAAWHRARWPWFLVGVAVTSWGHVLGLATAGGVTAWRLLRPVESGERWRVAGGACLLAAPLVAGGVRLSLRSSTFSQPEFQLERWLEMVLESAGPEAMLVFVVAIVGLVASARAPRAAAGTLALVYGAALIVGVAAPHQRPYLGLFVPLAGLSVGVALEAARARRPLLARAVMLLLCLTVAVRGGRGALSEWQTVQSIQADLTTTRGIDVALAESRDGDTLWLVAPALRADDDKTDHSSVLWRVSPWTPMPRAEIPGVRYDFTDWLWGQPRRVEGRVLHTSTELEAGRFDRVVGVAHQHGGRVFVVLYDHSPATGLLERVARTVRIYAPEHRVMTRDRGLGDDHVWILSPDGAPSARP